MVEGFEDTRGEPISMLLYFIGVGISAKKSFTLSAMRLSLERTSPRLLLHFLFHSIYIKLHYPPPFVASEEHLLDSHFFFFYSTLVFNER